MVLISYSIIVIRINLAIVTHADRPRFVLGDGNRGVSPTNRGTGLQVVRTALKGSELSDVGDETMQRAAAQTEINK